MIFCCSLLLYISTVLNLAVSSTTIYFPSSTPRNYPMQQEMLPAENYTDSSFHMNYGESAPDMSNIRFQNDDSSENSSTVEDYLIEKSIPRGLIQFTLQLDFALSSQEYKDNDDKSNLVFSPASIAAALALVLLGSAGKTYTEIINVLGLASGIDLNDSGDELHYHFGKIIKKIDVYPGGPKETYATMAGAVFVQDGYPIKERFARLSKDIYASEVLNLDFIEHTNVARDVINNWVENRTHGHILNILDYPPPPSTKVIIASALYFNGAWEIPFTPEQTAWRPFYVEGSRETGSNEVLQVLMMVTGGELPYYSDSVLGCQVVGLPYKGRTATMYLILPNEPGYQALKRLQYRLTVNHLLQLADSTTERIVITAVPRMQLESTIHLKEALKLLGVRTLFDPFQANLSQISDQGHVYSPTLVQHLGDGDFTQENVTIANYNVSTTYENSNQTFTNSSTDEVPKKQDSVKQRRSEGTECCFSEDHRTQYSNVNPSTNINPGLYADNIIHKVTIDVTETGTEAAAASVVSITRDGSHKVVRFERPFLFFIHHKQTGIVLFWGTVVKPTPNRAVS